MISRKILSSISRPGRYLGQEYNSVNKQWAGEKVSFALVFPDLYEIGMSHQGLQILYHLLNSQDSVIAERCYCPEVDVERRLRKIGEPLKSLESEHHLQEFDVLGFTLPYELCYTNILTVLDLAGIPFYTRARDASCPLIFGGGACAFNPEPVAEFFDAILLGDGEEAILEIAELLLEMKGQSLTKEAKLERLAGVEGVYVPGHYEVSYDRNLPHLPVRSVIHKSGTLQTVSRRIVSDLDDIEHLKHPLVPNAKIVHDRLGIEVARGCTRGCRFCQAGIVYRPVRERKIETVLELAQKSIKNSGFDELSLLSLSTGDYSCLAQVLPPLMDEFVEKSVSVAMPSLRVGTMTPAIMEQIKRVRKSGFTLAPEAGSERLRRVINKGISEEDLLITCREAFALGWRVIKCYFMVGLPTEGPADIEAIADLARKILATRSRNSARSRMQVNVSVGTFVPKPHTPFQWEEQLSIEESSQRFRRLIEMLPKKGANLRYHNPKISFLEGVFSRGDRRLSRLIEEAWRAGARLDGWIEHFSLELWQEAAESCGIVLEGYLRKRAFDEVLPWAHLQSGVSEEFLFREREKGMAEGYTPDCRYHSCQKCGLCDFDSIFPRVHNRKKDPCFGQPAAAVTTSAETDCSAASDGHYRYMVHYSRTGRICYLGHLEILQVVLRTLRRAGLALHYSQGFNPSPKVSFGPALPVGTESYAEFFTMDLKEPLSETAAAIARLNKTLPPGLVITRIERQLKKLPQKIRVLYTARLDFSPNMAQRQAVDGYIASSSYPVKKLRKGKEKSLDIRPIVERLAFISEREIRMQIIVENSRPGIKPIEALSAILGLTEEEAAAVCIVKNSWQQED
ncbi:MAG: B12-binding domain-containing radical SAM protein [Deltaproteobacteria bacterium]|nr:MAG: B12-binding domain-containing radical SAM protein [Deltaproteobacteria bacterium]